MDTKTAKLMLTAAMKERFPWMDEKKILTRFHSMTWAQRMEMYAACMISQVAAEAALVRIFVDRVVSAGEEKQDVKGI